jgi:hypothetical protein
MLALQAEMKGGEDIKPKAKARNLAKGLEGE